MIKAKVDSRKGNCVEELPGVLWAYRTTTRTPTRETPFNLTDGLEAMIPVEMVIHTYRVTNHESQKNEEELWSALDLLKEKRGEARMRNQNYQKKVEQYYNARVREQKLKAGELVLQEMMLAQVNPADGKLHPMWEGPHKVTWNSRPGTYYLEYLEEKPLPHLWNIAHLRKYYQ